jgi:phosphopantothenoylcysteine decarboxylase/phosphopantothenate--cysteine ligase
MKLSILLVHRKSLQRKNGICVREALANEGATVNLVSGPTKEYTNHPRISVKPVVSAEEMFNVCASLFPDSDITCLQAAVADYKPLHVACSERSKKRRTNVMLELTKTQDIAASLTTKKHNGQIVVGFALETEDEKNNAIKKLDSKKFDLIVLNSLNDNALAFGT